jgi:hypothetical protein
MTEETEATQGLPEGEAVATAAEENPVTATEETTTEEAEAKVEEPEAKTEEDEAPKKTPWFQRRIDDLTREKWELRRELEAFQSVKPQPEAEQGDLVPKSEIDRLAALKAREYADADRFNADSNAAYDKGKAEFGDWDDALGTFRMLGGLNRDVIDAALATGEAHKVLYALGKDPDRAAEIISLPPTRMAVALTKLATAAPAAPKPKPVSAAPAPVTPVNGGPRVHDDPDKMSMDEWAKWRERTANK